MFVVGGIDDVFVEEVDRVTSLVLATSLCLFKIKLEN